MPPKSTPSVVQLSFIDAERECAWCGGPLLFPSRKQARSRYEKRKFCSVLCRNRANAQMCLRDDLRKCERCHHRAASQNGRFCPKCYDVLSDEERLALGVYRRRHQWTEAEGDYVRARLPFDGRRAVAMHLGVTVGQIDGLAKRLGIKIPLETLERISYQPARERIHTDNPMHNASVVEKVKQWHATHPEESQRTISALMAGQQRANRAVPSGLERRLHRILDDLGISYEPSALIKDKFVVDVRIDSLIIQADGEWWHGHPRFAPLRPQQIAQQKRDRSHDAYLAACGYTVVRLWDRDVTAEQVRRVLESHGFSPSMPSP